MLAYSLIEKTAFIISGQCQFLKPVQTTAHQMVPYRVKYFFCREVAYPEIINLTLLSRALATVFCAMISCRLFF